MSDAAEFINLCGSFFDSQPKLRSIYYPSTRRLASPSTLEVHCTMIGTPDDVQTNWEEDFFVDQMSEMRTVYW